MGLALPKRMQAGGGVTPPVEFADAVELYARRHGRSARLRFVPFPVNSWAVEFEYRANDPRRLGIQQGRTDDKEVIYLWRDATPKEIARVGRWHRVGYKLDELGVSGMIDFLERTNLFSGRGEYSSVREAMKDQDDKRERGIEKIEKDAREDSRHAGMDLRRQILDIPYLPVGIDLKQSTTPKSASSKE